MGLTPEELEDATFDLEVEIEDTGWIGFGWFTRIKVPLVRFSGNVMGQQVAPTMQDLLARLNGHAGAVVIDLGDCSYVSSAAIGFLTALALQQKESNRAIYLCRVNVKMEWVLGVLNIDDFYCQRETVAEAVEELLAAQESV